MKQTVIVLTAILFSVIFVFIVCTMQIENKQPEISSELTIIVKDKAMEGA